METRWWADEDVEATGHQWAWPLILDAIKAGNGVASARALSDDRLSRCAGLDQILALDDVMVVTEFERVGLIVEVDGGWTARSWDEYQRADEAKRDRQKRYRDRKKSDVTATSRDATATPQRRNGDVAATATVQYTDTTQQNMTVAVVAEASRALPAGPSTAPATSTSDPGFPDDFGRVESAFRSTQSGRYAITLSPADVAALVALTLAHGAGKVADACKMAAEGNNRERVSVAFLRAILENAGKPRGSKAGQVKPHGSHSIWEKHGMEVPQMVSGPMDKV
jgi:hypothetical protein